MYDSQNAVVDWSHSPTTNVSHESLLLLGPIHQQYEQVKFVLAKWRKRKVTLKTHQWFTQLQERAPDWTTANCVSLACSDLLREEMTVDDFLRTVQALLRACLCDGLALKVRNLVLENKLATREYKEAARAMRALRNRRRLSATPA